MWESSSVTTLANPPAGSPATPGWPGYNLHTKPYFTLAIKPQFLFLSAFSGMLMQGYHNRKLITQFFHSNSCEIVPCYLLGYGVPIIIMVYSLTCSVLCNWDCGGTELSPPSSWRRPQFHLLRFSEPATSKNSVNKPVREENRPRPLEDTGKGDRKVTPCGR